MSVKGLVQPDRARIRLGGTTLIAFVLLVFIGGGNAVAVRFSNLELPPFWGAATRFASASLIFWLILLARRIGVPRGRALVGTVLYGLLSVGASYAFLYWGLVRLEAGVVMVTLSFVPLLTLFFAAAHRLEPLRWRGVVGALVAVAGILLGVAGRLGADVPVVSLLAVLAGAACAAEAGVIYKLFPACHPVATNAIGAGAGAALLVVVSLLAGEPWALPASPVTWAAFAHLVIIGTVVLFYLYLYVLTRWTASATSYAFLLFPVATVILAAWLAGEAITPAFALGSLIVLLGVWLGTMSGRAPKAV